MAVSKYDFPLKHISGNLIYNTIGDVWAVYELGGFTYDFKGDDKKFELRNNLARLLSNIGNDAKIFIYPIARKTNAQFNRLRKNAENDIMSKPAIDYFNNVQKYISKKTEERGNINDYQFFLAIKLKNISLDQSLGDMVKDVPRTLNSLLKIETDYIRKDEISLYKESSHNLLYNIRATIDAIEATPEQTQWLLGRMMSRGLGINTFIRRNADGTPWEPSTEETEVHGKKAIKPQTNELRTLFEGTLVHNKKCIEVETSDGKSYQSFLQLSHLPNGLAFPGGEFIKRLYDLPVASEICITIKPIDFQKAKAQIKRQSDKIKGQIDHTVGSGEQIPEELQESMWEIEELERELKANRDPLIDTTITICLSGDDKEQLEYNVTYLRNYYKDASYRIENSAQDQLMSFYQMIPGTQIYETDYKHRLTPKTLATSMFLATRELGDRDGSYIGTIGSVDKPIYLNPFLATTSKFNRSPACFFMGTLGGGKSFNSNLLTYSVIMQGARALIVDPKSERGKWSEELPEFAPFMSTTTLGADSSDIGKLDPFNIYRDELHNKEKLEEAADLARNILMELYNITPGSNTATVLSEAIAKMKNGVKDSKGNILPPSMELIYIMLKNTPKDDALYNDALLLARSIKATQQIGMSKLLFGRGNEKGLSFDTRINILQIDGLNMPDPALKKEEYNESQKLSTVLMIPIASFAKKFASQNRSEKKVILLDESWALMQTTEGRNLFNYLARTGRSLNCCTIFIGHSVKDVDDEGLKAAITYKFCFKVNTSEEARASLKFMELDDTDSNIETLMKMPNGHALFKDLNGNVDILKFDAVDDHIAFAFNTSTDKYLKKGK